MKIVIEIEAADIAKFEKRLNALPPSTLNDLMAVAITALEKSRKPKTKVKPKKAKPRSAGN